MSWILYLLNIIFAFGPVILGVILWHLLWNKDSGSSSDPPGGGGSQRRPVPPSPGFSGDRQPCRPHPGLAPSYPDKRRA